jgi:hypothetical protein
VQVQKEEAVQLFVATAPAGNKGHGYKFFVLDTRRNKKQ